MIAQTSRAGTMKRTLKYFLIAFPITYVFFFTVAGAMDGTGIQALAAESYVTNDGLLVLMLMGFALSAAAIIAHQRDCSKHRGDFHKADRWQEKCLVALLTKSGMEIPPKE